ncbi:MAG: type III-B CRISPR-associated protein Cas10/Cmr2 [Acidobacteriota bacterium]
MRRAIAKEIWRATQELGPPPRYYAVLLFDGDEMGRWLAGEKSPAVGDILHPRLRAYFEGLDGTSKGLEASRPLGPARHAAISEALANFALYAVPTIVARHHGTLIYAGGDDVLALSPSKLALACCRELRLSFAGDPSVNGGATDGFYRHNDGDRLMMGSRATASAGLAVVHHKEDLRFALNTARRAEREAKDSGRDILRITACRRSGEHVSTLCPWGFVEEVQRWVRAFTDGASDRWAYHLRGGLDTLAGLPVEAMRAEIYRQVERSEEDTRRRLRGDAESAGGALTTAFERYRAAITQPSRGNTDAEALCQFVSLCQTASFFARGGRA